MAEIRSGLRHLLARPGLYDLFQGLVGGYSWRRRFVREHLAPIAGPGTRVVDIGCGTGDMVGNLPPGVEYFGFDRNPDYIAAARRRFGGRGAVFECEAVGSDTATRFPPFDIALAMGLVHHLDDRDAIELLRTARQVLKPSGVLFLLDPLLMEGQSRLARFVVSSDRGRNVRTSEEYLRLCRQVFEDVRPFVDPDPIRIPYTGIVISCASGRAA